MARGYTSYHYHPARRLVGALSIMLLLHGLLCLVAVLFGWSQIGLLQDFLDGVDISAERADANDARVGGIGIAQTAVLLPLFFVFAAWLLRANRNARAISPTPLTNTPGWTVGWYFVPIANWWKPFQAMREIWSKSHLGGDATYRMTRAPVILGGWWFLWLASTVLAQVATRLSRRAEEVDALLRTSWVTLCADLVDVALAIVACLLVRGVSATQAGAHVEKVFE